MVGSYISKLYRKGHLLENVANLNTRDPFDGAFDRPRYSIALLLKDSSNMPNNPDIYHVSPWYIYMHELAVSDLELDNWTLYVLCSSVS